MEKLQKHSIDDQSEQKYIFFWKNNSGPYSSNEEKIWQPFDNRNQIQLNQMYNNFCENSNNYIFNLLSPANDCAVNLIKMLLYDFDSNFLYQIKADELNKYTYNMEKKNDYKNNDLESINYFHKLQSEINVEEINNINHNPQINIQAVSKKEKEKIDIDYILPIKMEKKADAKENKINNPPFNNEIENNIKNMHMRQQESGLKEIYCKNKNFIYHSNKDQKSDEKNINNNMKFSQIKEEFIFFWKSNKDPWDPKQKPSWTPYDLEDESKLKIGYQQYLNDNSKYTIDLKEPADHYVDFSKMLQINKHDLYRSRPIQRSNPNLITNIVRKNRFDNPQIFSNVKMELIEQQTLKEKKLKFFFKNSNYEKSKKINTIFFKIFPEFIYELKIDEQLCFFNDESTINISLREMKKILIEEIINLGKEEGHLLYNGSQNIYKSYLEKIEDYKTFYETMVYIYTMEGYLYKKLNNYLRISQKIGFEQIKYYYICLLASFEYFSQNTHINQNQDIIVYRASRCSEEEFKEYENKNNSNIIRIFKEFLSTSINPDIARYFFDKDDFENPDTKRFFWEIKIPKEIIKNESNNFADISKFAQFPWESEILIRSGAIIQIDKIVPFTENIENNEIKYYKNKYKKYCTLKTFSLASFFKLITLDPSIEYLDLNGNKLGENEKNILIMKEALEKNNSIKDLYLSGNKLGKNEKNFFYMKQALEKNNSIETLSLSENNLGDNFKNIIYLKEIIEKNNSIKKLLLGNNNLGEEKKILLLKEGLEKNKSIKELWLTSNNLGEIEKKILDGLKNSISINY